MRHVARGHEQEERGGKEKEQADPGHLLLRPAAHEEIEPDQSEHSLQRAEKGAYSQPHERGEEKGVGRGVHGQPVAPVKDEVPEGEEPPGIGHRGKRGGELPRGKDLGLKHVGRLVPSLGDPFQRPVGHPGGGPEEHGPTGGKEPPPGDPGQPVEQVAAKVTGEQGGKEPGKHHFPGEEETELDQLVPGAGSA